MAKGDKIKDISILSHAHKERKHKQRKNITKCYISIRERAQETVLEYKITLPKDSPLSWIAEVLHTYTT